MAITIEVTRGRYLRHLRDIHGWPLRECVQRLNAVLPSNDRVSHAWMHLLENDSDKCIMSPVRALAFAKVLGADVNEMGVDQDDWQAFALLTQDASDMPAIRVKQARARPRRSSSCIAGRDIVRLNVHLVCASSNAEARVWGGRRAHRT